MSEHASTTHARLLVVDGDARARNALVELLREEAFVVRSAVDGFKGMGQLDDWTADIVIADVGIPGTDGVDLVRKLRECAPQVGIIVTTAHGTLARAVAAIQDGADDYLSKPVAFAELLAVVRRTLAGQQLRRQNSRLKTEPSGPRIVAGVDWVGQSRSSRELLGLVRQVADSDASAMITGHGGTGKESVARALHAWSRRKGNAFVAVHCRGLAAEAIERLLFGNGFEGSEPSNVGCVGRAEGGTLFLDEIGDLPLDVQARLTRLLQEQQIERSSDGATSSVDVRVIAATTRDLNDDVRNGKFREDLFYRLNVLTLRTPSLAQRRDDIPALAMHFLERHAKKSGQRVRGFTDAALRVLMAADWPGNVAELQSCIERAVALCAGLEIEPAHLPRDLVAHADPGVGAPTIPGCSLAALEKYAILKTLEHVRGSTSKAAEILGISSRKIQYRLSEYRVDPGTDLEAPPGPRAPRPSLATGPSA